MGKTSSRSDRNAKANRKFEKEMQFYELVRSSVVEKAISKEKQKKKQIQQKKLKAYDLSSLLEHLPELSPPSESVPNEFKINSKTRSNLVLKEANQLKRVISHPVFQSDPLGAIFQHLLNTQSAADEKAKSKDSKKQKETEGVKGVAVDGDLIPGLSRPSSTHT